MPMIHQIALAAMKSPVTLASNDSSKDHDHLHHQQDDQQQQEDQLHHHSEAQLHHERVCTI